MTDTPAHRKRRVSAASRRQHLAPGVNGLQKDRVYERLLLDIIYGDLQPGDDVEERTLARRCASSVAPVRDALSRLALEGLVQRRPRLGTTVTELTLREVQEVFEARVVVEGHCATLAAQMATVDDLAALRGAFAGVEAVLEHRDFRALVQMDLEFHRGLARATHNACFVRMVSALHHNAVRFWYFALPRRSSDAVRREVDYHLAVLAALEARDPAAAAQAMRTVLGEFPETVKGLLLTSFEPR